MKKLSVIVCLFMFALMPLLAQVKQTVAVLGDSYSTFEGFIPKGIVCHANRKHKHQEQYDC